MTDTPLVDHYFPFFRFNLHRNPFGALSRAEQVAVTVPPVDLAPILDNQHVHIQVLGRKGRGKSTTLRYLQWQAQLTGHRTAYERIPRWQWRYHTTTTHLDTFALDEAQRLAPWAEARLFLARRQEGWRLIIGSHRDHRLAFALAGLPVVTVRVGQQTTRARLARILARRLAVFAKGNRPAVSFSKDAVDYLHRQFGSDLRSMNHALYDYFQDGLRTPGPITARALARYKRAQNNKNPSEKTPGKHAFRYFFWKK